MAFVLLSLQPSGLCVKYTRPVISKLPPKANGWSPLILIVPRRRGRFVDRHIVLNLVHRVTRRGNAGEQRGGAIRQRKLLELLGDGQRAVQVRACLVVALDVHQQRAEVEMQPRDGALVAELAADVERPPVLLGSLVVVASVVQALG